MVVFMLLNIDRLDSVLSLDTGSATVVAQLRQLRRCYGGDSDRRLTRHWQREGLILTTLWWSFEPATGESGTASPRRLFFEQPAGSLDLSVIWLLARPGTRPNLRSMLYAPSFRNVLATRRRQGFLRGKSANWMYHVHALA